MSQWGSHAKSLAPGQCTSMLLTRQIIMQREEPYSLRCEGAQRICTYLKKIYIYQGLIAYSP